jgi:hypothetical protein
MAKFTLRKPKMGAKAAKPPRPPSAKKGLFEPIVKAPGKGGLYR